MLTSALQGCWWGSAQECLPARSLLLHKERSECVQLDTKELLGNLGLRSGHGYQGHVKSLTRESAELGKSELRLRHRVCG